LQAPHNDIAAPPEPEPCIGSFDADLRHFQWGIGLTLRMPTFIALSSAKCDTERGHCEKSGTIVFASWWISDYLGNPRRY
jgi:hypothetical protein